MIPRLVILWLSLAVLLTACGLDKMSVPTPRVVEADSGAKTAAPIATSPVRTWVRTGRLVFSPDGRTLAGIKGGFSPPLSVELRDAAGHALREVPTPAHTLYWLAYLPSGQLLAAGEGTDNMPALWRIRDGVLQSVPLPRVHGICETLALSPDGRTVARGVDKGIVLDNLDTHAERTLSSPDARETTDTLVFSPDGRMLAAGAFRSLALWDLKTGGLRAPPVSTPWPAETMAFSPDGRTFAYSLNNGSYGVLRLDTTTGQPLPTLEGHRSTVPALLYTADGAWLISSGWDDKTLRVWDARSGRLQRILAVPLPPARVERDPATGRILGQTMSPSSPVTALAVSPDGRTLAGQSGESVLQWDLAGGQRRNGPGLEPGAIKCAVLSGDGKTLISGHYNGVLAWWDIGKGSRLKTLTVGSTSADAVAASHDGRTVAVASREDVLLWDGALSRQIGALHVGALFEPSLAFSPDGRTLAVTAEKAVTLWDISSRLVRQTLATGGGLAQCVAFSPDGAAVVSADSGRAVSLWDTRTGRMRWRADTQQRGVWAVSISPNGKTVACAGEDGTVCFRRTSDGAAEGLSLSMGLVKDGRTGVLRPDEALSVAFSPDGSELAAVSGYGTLKIWNVRGRREIRSVGLKGGGRTTAAFLPDGHRLLLADIRQIRLYDIRTGGTRVIYKTTDL